jgi:hypothetical protein
MRVRALGSPGSLPVTTYYSTIQRGTQPGERVTRNQDGGRLKQFESKCDFYLVHDIRRQCVRLGVVLVLPKGIRVALLVPPKCPRATVQIVTIMAQRFVMLRGPTFFLGGVD